MVLFLTRASIIGYFKHRGNIMQTIEKLTPDDLKQIIKESIRETLSEKKLRSVFYEVIEEIALSKAIDKGMNSESIDQNAFLKKLNSRIQ